MANSQTKTIKKAILGSDADVINNNFASRVRLTVKGKIPITTAAGTHNILDANDTSQNLLIPANCRIVGGLLHCTESFSTLTGVITMGTTTALTTNIITNWSLSSIGTISALQTNIFTASGTHLKVTADTYPVYVTQTAYTTGKFDVYFDLIQE